MDEVGCRERPPLHTEEVPDVASLKTPESPAFMLLGTAPTEIQRPSTPTGLATSLANGFTNGSSLSLFRNFALEVSPYWLFPRRFVAFERLVNEPERAFYRNLSISVASGEESVENEVGGQTLETSIAKFAIGARTTIIPGVPTREAMHCLSYLKEQLNEQTLITAKAHRSFHTEWVAAHPPPDLPPVPPDVDFYVPGDIERFERENRAYAPKAAAYQAWYQEYAAALALRSAERTEELTALADDPRFERCLSAVHAKSGLMLEVAGAHLLAAPEGDLKLLDEGGTQSTTGWLTLGYVAEEPFGLRSFEGSLLLAFRAESAQGSFDSPDRDIQRYDAGARLALAARRVGVGLEGTLRHQDFSDRDEAERLYRVALSVDYRVSGGMWLSTVFGKDFGDTNEQTPILALANLQWNFGLERSVEVDRTVTR
jgi:hypothetical protein